MPEAVASAGRAPWLARRATRLVLDAGLISLEEIHRYGIRARDLSQSNGVALVEAGNGRGYVAKDMRRNKSKEQGAPERELALYRAIAGREELRDFAPAFCEYDADREILILEGLTRFRRLDQANGGKYALDVEVAERFGDALGRWHGCAAAIGGWEPVRPWLFDIDGPDRLEVIDTEPALGRLVDEILASEVLRDALDQARTGWNVETVIHGDVRFSNTMVLRSPPSLRFIDWETSGPGDPAWDVAAAVQEYLSVGISGGRLLEGSPAKEPAVALLDAYRGSSPFPMAWSRIRAFLSCRSLLRAIQLENWEGDPGDAIQGHLELARILARSSDNPLRGSVS